LVIATIIGVIMWVIYRQIGKIDKTKEKQQAVRMKKIFVQALEEAGLAKKKRGTHRSRVTKPKPKSE
jgi:hypothetical protein